MRRPNLLPLLTTLKDTHQLRYATGDDRVEPTTSQRHMYRLYVCFVRTFITSPERGSHFRPFDKFEDVREEMAKGVGLR